MCSIPTGKALRAQAYGLFSVRVANLLGCSRSSSYVRRVVSPNHLVDDVVAVNWAGALHDVFCTGGCL